MLNLFIYDEYKTYLRDLCAGSRGSRGFRSRLAGAAGFQHSYLSQVLHSQLHLTPDHAFGIARHLGFGEVETEYFFALVELGRAGNPRLKAHLRNKLDQLKQKAQDLAGRVKRPSIVDGEAQARFYSSWHYGAIHIIVTIPEFQTPEAIAPRLNLPIGRVHSTLHELESMGLLKRNGDRWELASGDIHIPKESPLNSVNHQSWRTRAVLDSQDRAGDGIHYSVVFSASVEDLARIKAMLLSFIDEKRGVITPSPCEELACFACDLFVV